nr:biopolymer transporter ExbD [Pseudomonas sp. BN102]
MTRPDLSAGSESGAGRVVEVLLLLLVVFIITAPLLTDAIPISLPKTEQKDPHVGSIDGTGKLYIDKGEFQPDLVQGNLAADNAKDPELRVQLQADRQVDYDVVARAMASIERAGITRLAAITAR